MYLNIMINRLNLSLCLPKRPHIVSCLAIDLIIKLKPHLLKPVYSIWLCEPVNLPAYAAMQGKCSPSISSYQAQIKIEQAQHKNSSLAVYEGVLFW